MEQALSHTNRQIAGFDDLHTFKLPSCTGNSSAKSITIRLADCDGERTTANMLISRKYSGRGYGANHSVPTAPNCVTFTASSNNAVIGTLSLTIDSPDGLACDNTFKEELDKFRAFPDARLCELTKFAFDTSKPSLHLLASLFHIIFIYGTHHYNRTDLFIEVNPRHRRFYETMLGFKSIGPVKTNETVGAESNLMWLKVSEIRDRIDLYTKGEGTDKHSLYRFFFSKDEEVGIYNRLAGPLQRFANLATRIPLVEAGSEAPSAKRRAKILPKPDHRARDDQQAIFA